VTGPVVHVFAVRLQQPEMAQTAKFLYNLESLPHFDNTYEYGSLMVSIYTVLKRERMCKELAGRSREENHHPDSVECAA
jgi:hypothetical protein